MQLRLARDPCACFAHTKYSKGYCCYKPITSPIARPTEPLLQAYYKPHCKATEPATSLLQALLQGPLSPCYKPITRPIAFTSLLPALLQGPLSPCYKPTTRPIAVTSLLQAL